MLEQIISGAIGGLAFSLSGLAKANTKEKFAFGKMIPTIVVGLAVGAVAGYMNQDYGIVANTSLAAGITSVIENVWKAIYRRF